MTVTVKAAVSVFPASSDAVHVTIVGPTENVEPEAAEQVGPEVTPTLSVAVTVNVTGTPELLEVFSEGLDGTVITGGVVSSKTTVTVKLAVPTLPAASDAVQVTVVVPTGKPEPEAGEQVGPEVTAVSSLAVTVNVVVLAEVPYIAEVS